MPDPTNLSESLVQFCREHGGWHWGDDGRLRRAPTAPLAEVPWSYHNMTFQCVKWHEMFFKHASKETMVHSHCHECFKVVVAPRTLEELMELDKWQATTGFECKCGIELREFVNRKRLYGGYFYNRGLEAGRKRYQQVKEWVDFIHQKDRYEHIFLNPQETPMPVILKLGCTEFERALGDSRKYQITDDQSRLEAALDEMVDFDPFVEPEKGEYPQPQSLKEYVKLCWLKWAHHHGDMTYLKYMPDGKPFEMPMQYANKPPATYHDE